MALVLHKQARGGEGNAPRYSRQPRPWGLPSWYLECCCGSWGASVQSMVVAYRFVRARTTLSTQLWTVLCRRKTRSDPRAESFLAKRNQTNRSRLLAHRRRRKHSSHPRRNISSQASVRKRGLLSALRPHNSQSGRPLLSPALRWAAGVGALLSVLQWAADVRARWSARSPAPPAHFLRMSLPVSIPRTAIMFTATAHITVLAPSRRRIEFLIVRFL